MLHYIDKENNKKYTLILKDWLPHVVRTNNILTNGDYSKYECLLNGPIKCELIECSNLAKSETFCKKVIEETFEDYQEFISKRDFTKEQWVYNILDGISEQENILYRGEKFLIIPNYVWDGKDTNQMQLLVFSTDKTIHSIRDLNETHVEMLEELYNKTVDVILNTYGFTQNIVKSFVHYSPTSYQFHVHFILMSNTSVNSSVEYSHDFKTIIKNLKLSGTYYQTTLMKRV